MLAATNEKMPVNIGIRRVLTESKRGQIRSYIIFGKPVVIDRALATNPPCSRLGKRVFNLLKMSRQLPQLCRLAAQSFLNLLQAKRHQGRNTIALPRHVLPRASFDDIEVKHAGNRRLSIV